MCDYSLEAYESRAAVDGEDLVIKQFRSGSKGFVESWSKRGLRDEPFYDCAVCCKDGVEMTLHLSGTFQTRSIADGEPARTQEEKFDGEVPVVFHTRPRVKTPWGGYYLNYHRDGFLMPNGLYLSIQSLAPGTRATVTKALPKELIEAAKGGIASENDIEKRIADVAPLVQPARV